MVVLACATGVPGGARGGGCGVVGGRRRSESANLIREVAAPRGRCGRACRHCYEASGGGGE
eukprot:1106-Eustigmatos_ZCMA.PRE.1